MNSSTLYQKIAILSLASAAPLASVSAATALLGDHTVNANPAASPAEAGDLTISGNFATFGGIDYGKIPALPGQRGAMMTYDSATRSSLLDLTQADASYLWRQNTSSGTALSKMTLSGNNTLSLFKADGTAAGVKLDPNVGSITLSGLNSGIYNRLGSPVFSINSAGQLSFPTRPLFSSGVDFGSGGTLDSSKVNYLQGLLTNFGYQATPVTASAISHLDVSNVYDIQLAQAPNSELFMTGNCYGGARIGTYSLSGYGFFIARLYPDGSVRWLKKLNSAGFVSGLTLAAHPTGGLAIGGLFYASISLESSPMTLTGGSGYNNFAFKLSPDTGAPLWGKSIGRSSFVGGGTGFALSPNGDVTLGGSFEGTLLGENGTPSLTSAGDLDAYVAKLSSADGSRLWNQRIGGGLCDMVSSLAADASGNIYASGEFNGTASINGTPSTLISAGASDVFLVKFAAANGSLAWRKRIGGISYDNAVAVATDSTGNPVVVGNFEGNLTSANDGVALTGVGGRDGFVIKLSPSTGASTWARRIGGTSSDDAKSLAIDSANNIVVGGDFYSSSVTSVSGGAQITNKGEQDGYLAQFSSSGTSLSLQGIGGAWYDQVYSVFVANSRTYFFGRNDSAFRLGDTVIPWGEFKTHWSGNLITPAAPATRSFSWNGGVASGSDSFATGSTSLASGQGSTAFSGGVATGQNSFATGGATANQVGSFAHGSYSEATGTGSVAIGGSNNAKGYGSVALGGDSNYATGNYSIAMGTSNSASGESSVTIGSYLNAVASDSIALGTKNLGITHSNSDQQSIFELGNGSGPSYAPSKSNAITTLRNGQTTLTNSVWHLSPPLAKAAESYSFGEALVVEGHTRLKGKVIIEQAQGDISMGIYQ